MALFSLLPMAGAWQDSALHALADRVEKVEAFPLTSSYIAESLPRVAEDTPNAPRVQGLTHWMQEMPELLRRTAETGDATLRSPHGFTALQAACLYGDEALARALVEQGAEVNARPAGWEKMGVVGQSPLGLLLSSFQSTSHEMKLNLGRYLLEHGADPDTEMTYVRDYPALYWRPAYQMMNDSDLKLMLVEYGEQNYAKRPALMGSVGCPYDNPALVRRLVLGGIDPNRMAGEKNMNIIRAAVCVGDVELVRFLLEHGAKQGDAIFHIYTAKYTNSVFNVRVSEPTAPEPAVAIAKLLLDHGADINALDRTGEGLRIHYGRYNTPTAQALCEFFKSRGAVLHPDAKPTKKRRR